MKLREHFEMLHLLLDREGPHSEEFRLEAAKTFAAHLAEIEAAQTDYYRARAENERQGRRIAQLEAGLEPFAAIGEQYDRWNSEPLGKHFPLKDEDRAMGASTPDGLTVGHFRRAAQALSAPPAPDAPAAGEMDGILAESDAMAHDWQADWPNAADLVGRLRSCLVEILTDHARLTAELAEARAALRGQEKEGEA